MANLNNGGLTRVLNYLKTWVTNLLSSKSDTSHSHTWNDIVSKPSFANVATSGSYNDLSNKPTIPTVNNATLTIQKNSSNVATFTANASSNVTANISVPTKVSELTNDSGFITSSGSCNYANSAGAVAWDNVSGKPSTFTPSSHTHNYAGSSNAGGAASSTLKLETYKQGSTTETYGANYPIFAQWVDNNNVALKCTNYTVWVDKANSVAWGNVSGRPSFATVATSGSYNDLSNKPSIPSIDLRPQANVDANTFSDGVAITHYGSNGPSTSLGAQANDGALFQQCWSSAWKVQIAVDYRNGNLFTRGKNNGTWTAWRAVAYQNGTNGIAFGSYRVYVG